MLIKLQDYEVQELVSEGRLALIYRVKRKADGRSTIIKLLKINDDASNQILKHEFEVLQKIHSEYVIKALDLVSDSGNLLLVMEDFPAKTLADFIEGQDVKLLTLLDIATELAQAVGEIHYERVIHKDFKPQNILYNPDEKKLKIIDFGLAAFLPKETLEIVDPEKMEGSIAYISPEATGRMSHPIDYRSDIYSLGVVLYQLFTKALPFTGNTPLELIHAQIAKQPIDPCKWTPALPKTVSAIILKCLEKQPVNRYHSAFGLKNDFQKCRALLLKANTIPDFTIGEEDLFDHFHFPEKLYGRQEELKVIDRSFQECARGAFSRLVLSGYAGIGKSSLVSEAQKKIEASQARFAAANFDQFNSGVPYSGWTQVFESLSNSILVESEESIADWKERILEALGPNARLVADVVPSLKFIIGELPAAEEINSAEVENRFLYAITNFLRIFTSPSKPLVIFFDNVQWADTSSLKLLKNFCTNATLHRLMFMIAYRDNEIDAFHPLKLVLKEITSGNEQMLTYLPIQPLSIASIQELIQDSYVCFPTQRDKLAEILFHKTQGNPFFTLQFIKYLTERGLFYFDKNHCCWFANIEAIESEQVSDNVADLLIADLKKMNPSMLHLLKLGAMIGSQFSLDMVVHIAKISAKEAITLLDEAIKNDLIAQNYSSQLPGQNPFASYRFLHDRIRQAAFMFLDEGEKQQLHQLIGEILLKMTPQDKLQEKCIDIVNQLNQGVIPSENQPARKELIKLNLMAGLKAKDSAAYLEAIPYFEKGLSLLDKDSWHSEYDSTFSFHKSLALCLHITGFFEQAQKLYDLCLNHAKTDLERGAIYLSSQLLNTELQLHDKVLENCAKSLKLVQFDFDFDPSMFSILFSFFKIKLKLWFLNRGTLENLPLATNDRIILIGRILSSLFFIAFVTGRKKLFLNTALQIMSLTLKYGLLQNSCGAFLCYAIILGSNRFDDYNGCSEIGAISLRMAEKFPKTEDGSATVCNYYYMINRWKNHLKSSIIPLHNGYKTCVSAGIIYYAVGCAIYINISLLLTGEKLDTVLQEIENSIAQIRTFKTDAGGELLSLFVHREVCRSLKGMTKEPTDPHPIEFTNEAIENKETIKNLLPTLRYHVWHAVLLYLFGKFNEAQTVAETVLPKTDNFPNWPEWQVFYFFYALTLAALIQDRHKQKKEWKDLLKVHKLLERWAKASPVNYAHYELMARAEIQRIKDPGELAAETYKQAVEAAKTYGANQDIALSYELSAKYYLSIGFPEPASFFLKLALEHYANWGATAKCEDFKHRYGEYLHLTRLTMAPAEKAQGIAESSTTSIYFSSGTDLKKFDVNALMEASQILSKEIHLDKLIESLMNLVIVNAGADKAVLLLQDRGKLQVFAEVRADQPYQHISPCRLEEKRDIICLPIIKYTARTKQEVLLHNAVEEGDFRYDPYIVKNKPLSLLSLPLLEKGVLKGILYLENSIAEGVFNPNRMRLLTHLSSQMAISMENAQFYNSLEAKVRERTLELEQKNIKLAEMQEQLIVQEKLKERERLKSRFGKYVPNLQVLDLIAEKGLTLQGKEKEITVLFCDIRDFTSLSETLGPAKTVEVLNLFFTEMLNVVAKHHGFVDKFIGDAIMALFGGLEEDQNHAQNAVEAALEMKHRLAELNATEAFHLDAGIGINTGKVLLGNIGSKERLEYTAIGDTVNVASRLESLTKELQSGILIAESTRMKLKNEIQVKDIGMVDVKGKADKVRVYQVITAGTAIRSD